MNGKRVALYLRVSTDDQTVENQRQALTAASEARGWRIVEEFVDNGISGAKGRDKRSGFDRLIKAATRGHRMLHRSPHPQGGKPCRHRSPARALAPSAGGSIKLCRGSSGKSWPDTPCCRSNLSCEVGGHPALALVDLRLPRQQFSDRSPRLLASFRRLPVVIALLVHYDW